MFENVKDKSLANVVQVERQLQLVCRERRLDHPGPHLSGLLRSEAFGISQDGLVPRVQHIEDGTVILSQHLAQIVDVAHRASLECKQER